MSPRAPTHDLSDLFLVRGPLLIQDQDVLGVLGSQFTQDGHVQGFVAWSPGRDLPQLGDRERVPASVPSAVACNSAVSMLIVTVRRRSNSVQDCSGPGMDHGVVVRGGVGVHPYDVLADVCHDG